MSRRPNPKNERIKRRFLEYRKYAKRLSEKTLDKELAALERFDVWNGRKDFARFHIEWAMGFRAHLEQCKTKSGKPLGKSTTCAIMAVMREFTLWLSQQEGFRSRIKPADAEYFNVSRRDEAEARAAPTRAAPSIKQAKHALSLMPQATPRELRDKAVFALLCLTGIRAGALISLRLKHIDMQAHAIDQNPREVATKFGKRIDTSSSSHLPRQRTSSKLGRSISKMKHSMARMILCSLRPRSAHARILASRPTVSRASPGKVPSLFARS